MLMWFFFVWIAWLVLNTFIDVCIIYVLKKK